MRSRTKEERIRQNAKLVREECGFTPLSVRIGVTRQAVHQIINEETTGATARFAIASALGVSVRDMWPDEI